MARKHIQQYESHSSGDCTFVPGNSVLATTIHCPATEEATVHQVHPAKLAKLANPIWRKGTPKYAWSPQQTGLNSKNKSGTWLLLQISQQRNNGGGCFSQKCLMLEQSNLAGELNKSQGTPCLIFLDSPEFLHIATCALVCKRPQLAGLPCQLHQILRSTNMHFFYAIQKNSHVANLVMKGRSGYMRNAVIHFTKSFVRQDIPQAVAKLKEQYTI